MISIKLAAISPEQWRNRACKYTDPDLFFAERGSAAETEAKALCARCPRLRDCAEWAREAGLTDGVVASVRMPVSGQNRDAELAELDQIAATGQVLGEVGEAAA
ncbi:WhiB family transcriptional regulator [Nocardia salmonicida]|uniref:WhiB family transcriptional regulator n=1 Tax=Nocardia salmonicida TaxID=53431 RepID=UPI0033E1EC7C